MAPSSGSRTLWFGASHFGKTALYRGELLIGGRHKPRARVFRDLAIVVFQWAHCGSGFPDHGSGPAASAGRRTHEQAVRPKRKRDKRKRRTSAYAPVDKRRLADEQRRRQAVKHTEIVQRQLLAHTHVDSPDIVDNRGADFILEHGFLRIACERLLRGQLIRAEQTQFHAVQHRALNLRQRAGFVGFAQLRCPQESRESCLLNRGTFY